jgi:hypothetical protein
MQILDGDFGHCVPLDNINDGFVVSLGFSVRRLAAEV